MGVPSDGIPADYRGGFTDQDPYTKRDYREPSVIPASTYVPPAGPPTIDDIKAAFLELANRGQLGYAGRWCSACHSDLGAPGGVQPWSKKGFKAATGQDSDAAPWPQGGHDATCPVPVLLEFIDGGPTPYSRRRPEAAVAG